MEVLDKHKVDSYCLRSESGYWTNKEAISTCPSKAKRFISMKQAESYMESKQLDKQGFSIKPIIVGYIVYENSK